MLAALLLMLSTAGVDATLTDACLGDDPRGPLQLCFDPGNRLALGAGGAFVDAGGVRGEGLLLEGGLRLRRSRASRSHEHVAWSTEHALAQGWALREPGGTWQADAVAYDGLFLRHLDEGYVLLPTPHPTRLPFPFDVAVTARLGELARDPLGNLRLDVGRAGLLLDVARDPSGTRRAAVGPSLGLAVERPLNGKARFLAQPLTGGTLLLRLESAAGRWSSQLRVDAGWELVLPEATSALRVKGEGELERVVFAVNDAPVALRLSASALSSVSGHELRVGLGLVAAYDL